jgi:hypothetical protein
MQHSFTINSGETCLERLLIALRAVFRWGVQLRYTTLGNLWFNSPIPGIFAQKLN